MTEAVKMEVDESDEEYEVDFNVDEFIHSYLEQHGFKEMCRSEYEALERRMTSIDCSVNSINQILDSSQVQVQKLNDILSQQENVAPSESILIPDDDDVEVVATIPPTRQIPIENIFPGTIIRTEGSTTTITKTVLQPPSYRNLLRPIQADLSSQDVIPVLATRPNQPPPVLFRKTEVAVGMKVYARKANSIWYKGAVVEIRQKGMEKQYRVKMDGKGGMKTMSGKHIAFAKQLPPPWQAVLPVGSRIIGQYKDEYASPSVSMFAGIIAEPPNFRNSQRYLVFFDDGYAQYLQYTDIRLVCEMSQNVWDDIHPDSRDFIKEYLQQYPERPMVRLQKDQIVKTEWNGSWWTARVQEVDASLVKMFFVADKRTEWIYRGSTRLEPLFTELTKAEANKTGGRFRRHLVDIRSRKLPYVEYTRGVDETVLSPPKPTLSNTASLSLQSLAAREALLKQTARKHCAPIPVFEVDDDKHRAVAKKSTGGKMSNRDTSPPRHESGTVENEGLETDAADMQARIANRKKIVPHTCCSNCLKDLPDDPAQFRGNNPLRIPMLCGWERQIAKLRTGSRRVVIYRAPCCRRLRCMAEIHQYLIVTDSKLTVDLFSFEVYVHTYSHFIPLKTYCDIKDISYGKEHVAISCVNGIDRQYPEYVEYSTKRLPAKGVHLNLNPDFLFGCDCTDDCQDKSKCACWQLSLKATSAIPAYKDAHNVGYEFRRLKEAVITGIYECNSKCKCRLSCLNRVAQNGLQLRLQVFKTEKMGWGLRCLDDIPMGTFLCIYAGQLLNEQGANEDGHQYGDEYLAELDHIEVVERMKEGYESDAVGSDESGEEEEEEEDGAATPEENSDSDSSYSLGRSTAGSEHPGEVPERRAPSRRNQERLNKLILRRESSSFSKDKEWILHSPTGESGNDKKTADWIMKSNSGEKKHSRKDKKENGDNKKDKSEKCKSNQAKKESKDSNGDIKEDSDDELPDLETKSNTSSKSFLKKRLSPNTLEMLKQHTPARCPRVGKTSKWEDVKPSSESDLEENSNGTKGSKESSEPEAEQEKPKRMSRFFNLPNPKQAALSSAESKLKLNKVVEEEEKVEEKEKFKYISVRTLFGEEHCYVMDAKSIGNIGRYLNHSCTPNVFVQNVFVDTHDLRFPWVAFFALQYIRAGQELTWDYNYEVGSVPGKILYCYCGSAECRGRLL